MIMNQLTIVIAVVSLTIQAIHMVVSYNPTTILIHMVIVGLTIRLRLCLCL